jgi:hypothetical protein
MENDELLAATKSHLEDYEQRHAGMGEKTIQPVRA